MQKNDAGTCQTGNDKKNSNTKTGNRRLDKYLSAGLFKEDKNGNKYTRATHVAELKEAYSLVYKIFIEQKFISERKSKMRIRPWETSQSTATFVSKKHNVINGVFSMIMDSHDLKLPSDRVYGMEIEKKRNDEKIICELTNQAIVKDARLNAVSTQLMRCVFAQAWHMDATDLICSISPGQKAFFELIGFVQVGDKKSYSDIIEDPVVLMWLEDIQNRWISIDKKRDPLRGFWQDFFITNNQYMETIEYWNAAAATTFNNTEQLGILFEQCEELFYEATSSQLIAMQTRLGDAIDFDKFHKTQKRKN